MGKTRYMRLRGSRHLRQRLVLATLTATPIVVEEIHSDDTFPGLRPHEVSLFRLLEKITDHSFGRSCYTSRVLIGGKNLVHDCGLSRSIGYFLEPLILLGLFGKKPLSIRLKGVTNDSKDPSVDTFRTTTLHMLKRFGVPLEGLELKIESRGAPPLARRGPSSSSYHP
uniref:RNA 3'-terminal phosphate cyclase domain-containing protein n=1 Tax=Ananas comosus var. bracteatus TaxID=296719 RepID=A0A6V7NE49_ANACO|nr:unnamed protein product [Ananas comosus var. bracteatus]